MIILTYAMYFFFLAIAKNVPMLLKIFYIRIEQNSSTDSLVNKCNYMHRISKYLSKITLEKKRFHAFTCISINQ